MTGATAQASAVRWTVVPIRGRFEVTAAHAVAWSVIVALQGLLLGSLALSLYQLSAVAVIALLWRLLRQEGRAGWRPVGPAAQDREDARAELLARLTVAAVPLMLLLTPAWNFQWGWQWDQGLYEVYANHFASAGTFFWDISAEVAVLGERAVWLTGPTGFFDLVGGIGDEPLRGARLPGYAVWLALVKLVVGVAGPVWVGNVVIATLVALLLNRVARLAGASRWSAVGVTSLITVNIAFLYNAKQFVAEPLGLLGMLLIVIGLLESAPSMLQRISLVFSGTLLTLVTKVDAWQPLLIVASLVMLGAVRKRSTRPLVLSMLLASSSAAAMLPDLTTERYLTTLRLPRALRGEMLFIGQDLIVALLALLAIITLWLWMPVGERLAARLSTRASSPVVRHTAPAMVAIAWAAFGVWAWWLRPRGLEFTDFAPRDVANAFNLSRLAMLWSPLAIISVFVGLIAPLRSTQRAIRALSLGFALAFALVLLDAQNQPSELWWVRRYLLSFAPLAALTLGSIASRLEDRLRRSPLRHDAGSVPRRSAGTVLVGSVLGLAILVQAGTLQPLLRATQNEGLDVIVREVLQLVPDGVPLIVTATTMEVRPDELMLGARDPVTQGIAAAVRSARTDLTLIEVPEWEVGCLARELGGEVAVLARLGATGSPVPLGQVVAAGEAEVRFPLWRTRFEAGAPPRGAERDYLPYAWELSLVRPARPDGPTRLSVTADDLGPVRTVPLRSFTGFGDTNGLIHWLGTRGSRTAPHDAFCNPGRLDPALLDASSVFVGDGSDEQPRGATDRSTGATLPGRFVTGQAFHSLEEPDAWWRLDLGEGESFAPDLITVRQRRNAGPTPHLVRDLALEGSMDGETWLTLVTGRHLGDIGEWQAFPVRDADAYRYLRLRQTGAASDELPYLVFADIELYGTLRSAAPHP
jgi:hypothetical protein